MSLPSHSPVLEAGASARSFIRAAPKRTKHTDRNTICQHCHQMGNPKRATESTHALRVSRYRQVSTSHVDSRKVFQDLLAPCTTACAPPLRSLMQPRHGLWQQGVDLPATTADGVCRAKHLLQEEQQPAHSMSLSSTTILHRSRATPSASRLSRMSGSCTC